MLEVSCYRNNTKHWFLQLRFFFHGMYLSNCLCFLQQIWLEKLILTNMTVIGSCEALRVLFKQQILLANFWLRHSIKPAHLIFNPQWTSLLLRCNRSVTFPHYIYAMWVWYVRYLKPEVAVESNNTYYISTANETSTFLCFCDETT